MLKTLFILVILAIYGCKDTYSKTEYTPPKFEVTKEIKPTVISEDIMFPRMVRDIEVYKD